MRMKYFMLMIIIISIICGCKPKTESNTTTNSLVTNQTQTTKDSNNDIKTGGSFLPENTTDIDAIIRGDGSTALHIAVESGDIEKVKLLIKNSADINSKRDFDNYTALHIAAETGQIEIAKFLIDKGADIEAKDIDNETPLHKASNNLRTKTAELLLDKGAKINAKNIVGMTPICLAIKPISLMTTVSELIETDYPEVKTDDDQYRELEENLTDNLIIDMVKLLIARDDDINIKNDYGWTPLHNAIDLNSENVIKTLLQNGANSNIKDKYGITPFYEAISVGNENIIDLMIEYKADVNDSDINGQTVLHEAIWNENTRTAQKLIANGADINALNRNGDTPLHIAALNGNKELYNFLIAHGADIKIINKQGETPLDYINSPQPKGIVMVSEPNEQPYSVIITDLISISGYLRTNVEKFDRIWILEKKDIEGFKTILKSFFEEELKNKKEDYALNYIFDNLDRYNNEYAGFIIDGDKYIICNMVLQIGKNPKGNYFTFMYDGGCSLVSIIYEVKSKNVIQVKCSYP